MMAMMVRPFVVSNNHYILPGSALTIIRLSLKIVSSSFVVIIILILTEHRMQMEFYGIVRPPGHRMWKEHVVWEKHVHSHVVVVLRVAKMWMLCVWYSSRRCTWKGCEGHVVGKGVRTARSAPCLDSPFSTSRLIGPRKNHTPEQDITCCDEDAHFHQTFHREFLLDASLHFKLSVENS